MRHLLNRFLGRGKPDPLDAGLQNLHAPADTKRSLDYSDRNAYGIAVSGTIEGYVTRQPWPWPIKIGIGTVALVGFLLYQWVVGRRAARLGQTGDLDEFEAGARVISAA